MSQRRQKAEGEEAKRMAAVSLGAASYLIK